MSGPNAEALPAPEQGAADHGAYAARAAELGLDVPDRRAAGQDGELVTPEIRHKAIDQFRTDPLLEDLLPIEYRPMVADSLLAAVAPDIRAAGAAEERERIAKALERQADFEAMTLARRSFEYAARIAREPS